MSTRMISILAVALALCVSAAAGQRTDIQAGGTDTGAVDSSGIVYRLAPDSTYAEGCVGDDPACACPVVLADAFRGTFVLSPLPRQAIDDPIRRWAVRDANWLATIQGEPRRIIGHGVLEIGSPGPTPVVQIRMRLSLRIDGAPPKAFDSGWQPLDQLATIVVDLLPVSDDCLGEAIHLVARPVPADEIIPYALRPGSVFREGCYDPCDCPIVEVRIEGTLGLVPLGVHGSAFTDMFEEWALVRIRWRSVEDAIADPPFIVGAGSGMYRIDLGSLAPVPPHRLTLDLRVNRDDVGNPVHFDSGWVPQTVGIGSEPPIIVIEAAQNGFFCFDRVWAIDARPAP